MNKQERVTGRELHVGDIIVIDGDVDVIVEVDHGDGDMKLESVTMIVTEKSFMVLLGEELITRYIPVMVRAA